MPSQSTILPPATSAPGTIGTTQGRTFLKDSSCELDAVFKNKFYARLAAFFQRNYRFKLE